MKFLVAPYKMASESGKAISNLLGIKRIGDKGKPISGEDFTLINWGRSKPHARVGEDVTVLNPFDKVAIATNKLKFFEAVREDIVPKYFTTKEDASQFLTDNPNKAIVCRTVLSGHSGAGIVIADKPEELVDAKLYTEYVKKVSEYRVHFTKTKGVLCIARKARNNDIPNDQVNWRVRNMDSGFIFAYDDMNKDSIPSYDKMVDVCKKVFEDLDLDFGAIDLIYNSKGDFFKVLEVNTACGLNHTVPEAAYKSYFSGMMRRMSNPDCKGMYTSDELKALIKEDGLNPLDFHPVVEDDKIFWTQE